RSRASCASTSARSAAARAGSTGPGNGNRSASDTTPSRRLAAAVSTPSRARMYSVEPPPMSKATTTPGSGPSPATMPASVRRASSSPLITRTATPAARSRSVTKARPLAASRTALVATTATRAAPAARARATYPTTAAAAVADLPEQLTVGLGRDLRRRPVRGLGRRQRGGGGTIALAAVAVAGHAVLLGELLALGDQLRVVLFRRVLGVLRVGGRLPFPLRPDAGRDCRGERGGGNGDGQWLAERPHGISSREENDRETAPRYHARPRAASMSFTRVNFTRGFPVSLPRRVSISSSRCQSWYDRYCGCRSPISRSTAAVDGSAGR